MKIKWLGHSSFLLTSDKGIKVLTDPFDEKVGYPVRPVSADIVTISHDHYDHNNRDAAKGAYVLLNKPGRFSVKDIGITGTATCHDEQKGARRGKNVIFTFEIDGMRICHCGDLGHMLSAGQAADIGRVDVLLLPVGGVFTIDAQGAVNVMNALKPAVTIPMHFWTEALKFTVDGVDKFLAAAGGGTRTGNQEMEINKENLPDTPSITVLNYK